LELSCVGYRYALNAALQYKGVSLFAAPDNFEAFDLQEVFVSKQLALSACLSVLAMAPFAFLAVPDDATTPTYAQNETGTAVEAAAPDMDRIAPAVSDFTS